MSNTDLYYKALVDFLISHGYLILPGIGELCLVSSSSHNILNKEYISPGFISLELSNKSKHSIQEQLSFLSEHWGVEQIKCLSAIQKIATHISKRSSQGLQTMFPGLGYFYFQKELIQFKSSKEIEKKFNYFNKELALHPVFVRRNTYEMPVDNIAVLPLTLDDQMVSDKSEHINQLPEASYSENNNEWLVLRPRYYKLVAACLLCFIVGLVGLQLLNNTNYLVEPVKFNLDSVEYSVDEINRSPESDGTEDNVDKVLSNDSTGSMNSPENQNNEESIPAISNSELESIDDPELAEQASEKITESCIYIVGSFSKSAYANQMLEKIKALNMTAYKAPFNGNTRIGVIIPCNNAEALHQLDSIENDYWLLQE